MRQLIYIFLLVNLLLSCNSEPCKIDFERNSKSFYQIVKEIHALNLKKDSKKTTYRIVKSFNESSSPFKTNIFEQIEFIECHEDGTIIFQAPDCDKESDFRNVINFLAYSTKGKYHLEKKRNIGNLKEIKENWFLGQHIETLAN